MGLHTSKPEGPPKDLNEEIAICTNCCCGDEQPRVVFRPARTVNLSTNLIGSRESRTIKIPPCLCTSSCPYQSSRRTQVEEQAALIQLRKSIRSSLQRPLYQETMEKPEEIAPKNFVTQIFCCETSYESSLNSAEIELDQNKNKLSTKYSNHIKICNRNNDKAVKSEQSKSTAINVCLPQNDAEKERQSIAGQEVSTLAKLFAPAEQPNCHSYEARNSEKTNSKNNVKVIEVTSSIQIYQRQASKPQESYGMQSSNNRENSLGILYDRRGESFRESFDNTKTASTSSRRGTKWNSVNDHQYHATPRGSYESRYDNLPKKHSFYDRDIKRDNYGKENHGEVQRKNSFRYSTSIDYGYDPLPKRNSFYDENSLKRSSHGQESYGRQSTARINTQFHPTKNENILYDRQKIPAYVRDARRDSYGHENYGRQSTARISAQFHPTKNESDLYDQKRDPAYDRDVRRDSYGQENYGRQSTARISAQFHPTTNENDLYDRKRDPAYDRDARRDSYGQENYGRQSTARISAQFHPAKNENDLYDQKRDPAYDRDVRRDSYSHEKFIEPNRQSTPQFSPQFHSAKNGNEFYDRNRNSTYDRAERRASYDQENYDAASRRSSFRNDPQFHSTKNENNLYDQKRFSTSDRDVRKDSFCNRNYGTPSRQSTVRNGSQFYSISNEKDLYDQKRNLVNDRNPRRDNYGQENYDARSQSIIRNGIQSLKGEMTNDILRKSRSTVTFVKGPNDVDSKESSQDVGGRLTSERGTIRRSIDLGKGTTRKNVDCCVQTSRVYENQRNSSNIPTQTSKGNCFNVVTQTAEKFMCQPNGMDGLENGTSAKSESKTCIDIRIQTSATIGNADRNVVETAASGCFCSTNCTDASTTTSHSFTDQDFTEIGTTTSESFNCYCNRNAETAPMNAMSQQCCMEARTQTSASSVNEAGKTTSIQSLVSIKICPWIQIEQENNLSSPYSQDTEWQNQEEERNNQLGVLYDRRRDSLQNNEYDSSRRDSRSNSTYSYQPRRSLRESCENAVSPRSSRRLSYASFRRNENRNNNRENYEANIVNRDVREQSCQAVFTSCCSGRNHNQQEERDFNRENYDNFYASPMHSSSMQREHERGYRGGDYDEKHEDHDAIDRRKYTTPRASQTDDEVIKSGIDHGAIDRKGNTTPRASQTDDEVIKNALDHGAIDRKENTTPRASQTDDQVIETTTRPSQDVNLGTDIIRDYDSSSSDENDNKSNLMVLQPVVVCCPQTQQPCCPYPCSTTICDYSCYSYGCEPCCSTLCPPLPMPCCTPPQHINNCFSIDPGCFNNIGYGSQRKRKHKNKSRNSRASGSY